MCWRLLLLFQWQIFKNTIISLLAALITNEGCWEMFYRKTTMQHLTTLWKRKVLFILQISWMNLEQCHSQKFNSNVFIHVRLIILKILSLIKIYIKYKPCFPWKHPIVLPRNLSNKFYRNSYLSSKIFSLNLAFYLLN